MLSESSIKTLELFEARAEIARLESILNVMYIKLGKYSLELDIEKKYSQDILKCSEELQKKNKLLSLKLEECESKLKSKRFYLSLFGG